jgi:hypothetical protein
MQWVDLTATPDEARWLHSLGALMDAARCARIAASVARRRLHGSHHMSVPASDAEKISAWGATVAGRAHLGVVVEGIEASGTFGQRRSLRPETLQRLNDGRLPRPQWLWLERQRAIWRAGRLPAQCTLMLYAAGIDLSAYGSEQWRVAAHDASALLTPHPVPTLDESGYPIQCAPRRTAVRRWVLTQQQLQREGRLSDEQLEYMASLGLGWLLHPQVARMSAHNWGALYGQLRRCLAEHPGAPQLRAGTAASEHSGRPTGPRELPAAGTSNVGLMGNTMESTPASLQWPLDTEVRLRGGSGVATTPGGGALRTDDGTVLGCVPSTRGGQLATAGAVPTGVAWEGLSAGSSVAPVGRHGGRPLRYGERKSLPGIGGAEAALSLLLGFQGGKAGRVEGRGALAPDTGGGAVAQNLGLRADMRADGEAAAKQPLALTTHCDPVAVAGLVAAAYLPPHTPPPPAPLCGTAVRSALADWLYQQLALSQLQLLNGTHMHALADAAAAVPQQPRQRLPPLQRLCAALDAPHSTDAEWGGRIAGCIEHRRQHGRVALEEQHNWELHNWAEQARSRGASLRPSQAAQLLALTGKRTPEWHGHSGLKPATTEAKACSTGGGV